MASQQPPARPWIRLTSIARPVVPPAPAPQPQPQAPPPAPAPAPAPAPQRPIISLSTFRPTGPPPPQELSPPPPPPPPMASPPPPSVPQTPPRQPVEPLREVSTGTPPRATTASVPSTPLVRTVAAPTSSLPASPAKLPSAPPPPAVTSSPVKPQVPSPARRSPPKPATIEPTIAMPAQMPMPMPSPKVVKPAAQTPPQSPSGKPVAPPPSPLVLPPPQLRAHDQPRIPQEAEQKTVLVQETVPLPPPSNRLPSLDGRIRPDDIPKAGIGRDTKNGDAERHRGPHPKKYLDSGEVPGMKVITLAGENKGATMELTRSPKHPPPHHLLHIKASPTSKSNGQESRNSSLSGSGGSSSDEGKQKKEKDKIQQSKSSACPPISAFMNSNVQSVNNSILYNSSCTHHDPGVHLALSRKPSNGSLHIKDLVKGHQP